MPDFRAIASQIDQRRAQLLVGDFNEGFGDAKCLRVKRGDFVALNVLPVSHTPSKSSVIGTFSAVAIK